MHPIRTDPKSHADRARSPGWALASLALAVLLTSLGTSIANVALPTLTQAFAAPFQAGQWVVLAYLLASTMLVVGAGRLGDLLGRRRSLLVGLAVFTAAAAACGSAPTLGFLIGARAVQGAGGAVMLALGMAMVGEAVPKARTGSAVGLLGTMSAVGTALGPSLGGALIAVAGWRAVFFAGVPLGLLALLLATRHLPAAPAATNAARREFDFAGAALLALTLGAYALALTSGHGRLGASELGLLLAAALLLAWFVRVERRARAPLLDWAALRAPRLAAGLLRNALVATVMMATLVVGPFYLTRVLGLEAAGVGGAMSVGPLLAALAGVPSGRLVDRFGAARMAGLGLGGMVFGAGSLALLPPASGLAGYVGAITVLTVAYALFQAANGTQVLGGLPPDRRGAIAGWLGLARNLGLVTGAAALGWVFATAVGTAAILQAPPADVAGGMRITFAVAASLLLVAVAIGGGDDVRAWRMRQPQAGAEA